MKIDTSKLLATVTVLLGLFIAAMESLISSTILPSIISSLGGIDLYPWVVSSFLLSLVVATPLFGKLADHWGFFKIYVTAIMIFFAGSFFCGISRSMPELIAARCVQGIGTAGLITLCILYVGIAYPQKIRHKMQALISSVWAIASLTGPALGAFLVTYFSWRFAFLVNIPLCFLILASACLFLKDLPRTKALKRFDLPGALMFMLVSFAFLYSLIQIGKLEYQAHVILLFILSCGSICFLLWRSSSVPGAFPSLEPLKRHPEILNSIALGFLGGAFLFSTANLLPLFVQGVQGDSVAAVGKVITSMALGTCAGSYITALILQQMGFRVISLLGTLFITSGLLSLALLSADSSLFMVALASFLTGTGIGISANGAIVATQSFSEPHQIGATTSMFTFFRSVGGMLAISLLGAIQLSAFRHNLGEKAIGLYQNDALAVLHTPEAILEPLQRPLLNSIVTETIAGSLGYSIHIAFLGMLPLVLLHLYFSTRMPNVLPHEINIIPDINSMGE